MGLEEARTRPGTDSPTLRATREDRGHQSCVRARHARTHSASSRERLALPALAVGSSAPGKLGSSRTHEAGRALASARSVTSCFVSTCRA